MLVEGRIKGTRIYVLEAEMEEKNWLLLSTWLM
jgi:hypothetical protein